MNIIPWRSVAWNKWDDEKKKREMQGKMPAKKSNTDEL